MIHKHCTKRAPAHKRTQWTPPRRARGTSDRVEVATPMVDALIAAMELGRGPINHLYWTRRQDPGRSRYTPHVNARELARRARRNGAPR